MGSFKISTFVKEICQNALDASISVIDEPVHVYFDLILVKKEERELVKKLLFLDTDFFQEKINKMTIHQPNEKGRFDEMIHDLNDESPFLLMRVIDTNTSGLIGSVEDLENGEQSNFTGFYFDFGFSKKLKGRGSFGEGRMAFIGASRIQTVVSISNRFFPKPDKGYQVYGMALHGPFQDGNKFSNGKAYLGLNSHLEVQSDYKFSDSSEFQEIIPNILEKKTGTAFYLPFFPKKIYSNDNRVNTEENLLLSLKDELEKWLFPAIISNELTITIRKYDSFNSHKSNPIDLIVLNNESISKELIKILSKSNKIEIPVEILVPSKKGEKENNFKEIVDLSLFKINSEKESDLYKYLFQNNIKNTICLIRNSMVIRYFRPLIITNESFLGIFSVNKSEHEKLEYLLRISEPPKHDNWGISSDRLRKLYGYTKGPETVRNIYSFFNDEIKDKFNDDNNSKEFYNEILNDLIDLDIPIDLTFDSSKKTKNEVSDINQFTIEKKDRKKRKGEKKKKIKRPKDIPPDEPDDDGEPGAGTQNGKSKDKDGEKGNENSGELNDKSGIVTDIEIPKKSKSIPFPYIIQFRTKTVVKIRINLPEKLFQPFNVLKIDAKAFYDSLSSNDSDNLNIQYKNILLPFNTMQVDKSFFPLDLSISLKNVPTILREMVYIDINCLAYNLEELDH